MKLDIDLQLELVAIDTDAERRAWEAAMAVLAELVVEAPPPDDVSTETEPIEETARPV